MSALEVLYGRSDDGDIVHAAGKELFEATRLLEKVRAARYTPANGAQYPRRRSFLADLRAA